MAEKNLGGEIPSQVQESDRPLLPWGRKRAVKSATWVIWRWINCLLYAAERALDLSTTAVDVSEE